MTRKKKVSYAPPARATSAISYRTIENASAAWTFNLDQTENSKLKEPRDAWFYCPECEDEISPPALEVGVNMLGSDSNRGEQSFKKVKRHGELRCQLACALAYVHHEHELDGPHTMMSYVVYCLARGVSQFPLTLDKVWSQNEVIQVVFQRFFMGETVIRTNSVFLKKCPDRKNVKRDALKKIVQIRSRFISQLENPEWQRQNLQALTPAQFINRLDLVMSNKQYFWECNFVFGGNWIKWDDEKGLSDELIENDKGRINDVDNEALFGNDVQDDDNVEEVDHLVGLSMISI
jgi:hypothetical protein